MNAGFVQEFIEIEAVEGNCWPVLYKKNTVEIIIRKQVFLACNGVATFRRRHNGRRAACHPSTSRAVEEGEEVIVQRLTC